MNLATESIRRKGAIDHVLEETESILSHNEGAVEALSFVLGRRFATIVDYVSYFADDSFPRSRADELDVAQIIAEAMWPRLRLLSEFLTRGQVDDFVLELFSGGLGIHQGGGRDQRRLALILGCAWCLLDPFDGLEGLRGDYMDSEGG